MKKRIAQTIVILVMVVFLFAISFGFFVYRREGEKETQIMEF